MRLVRAAGAIAGDGDVRAALVLPVLRVVLGLLFLSVWASNLHKGLYRSGPYAALVDGYADDGEARQASGRRSCAS